MNNVRNTRTRRLTQGTCVALAFAGCFIAGAKPPTEDTVTNPAPSTPSKGGRTVLVSGGGDGGLAGGTLLWDNGPLNTPAPDNIADCPSAGLGDKSRLQNEASPVGQCLNTLGSTNGGTSGFNAADDFTLTQAAEINSVTMYGYNTGAAAPNITGATVRLHSGRPHTPTSNVIATTTVVAASTFTNTFRKTNAGASNVCTRRIQQLVADTSAWPALPAGTYWVSWTLNSAVVSIFCPPVTVLGQYGKTGANAMQGTTVFNGLYDTGATPAGCPTYPQQNPLTPGVAAAAQDWPFRLDGDLLPPANCPADINDDGQVNVTDLLAVIAAWNATGSNPADINGDLVVNVTDLLAVIAAWGACAGGPPNPPAPATGSCVVAGNCNVQTFDACFLAGGTYGGDGSTCTGACCAAGSCTTQTPAACAAAGGVFAGAGTTCQAGSCPPPVNDTCATATAIAASQTFNNQFASTGGPTTSVACASMINNVTRDVWFSFNAASGTAYTISTGTSAGGTAFDTTIEVYSSPDCVNFTEEACNDDISATDLRSTAVFVGLGTTVYVRVGSWQAGGVGNVTLTVTPAP